MSGINVYIIPFIFLLKVVSEDARSGRYTINVYDMRNKLVAFHVLLPQGQAVKSICCQVTNYVLGDCPHEIL